jgi:bacterioferritin-associated ferredoxin
MHINFAGRPLVPGAGGRPVIVCVCKGVSDRRIREETAAGHPLDEVLRRTGTGSSCGQCRFAIARIVASERAAAHAAEQAGKQDAA